MVELIRVLFGNAFKKNDSLKLAVLTGCLRLSKESDVSALTETSEKRYGRFSQTSPKGDVLFTGQTLALFCLIPRHITPIVAKIQPQQTNPYQHSLNWMSR